jgi:hypothetical protein
MRTIAIICLLFLMLPVNAGDDASGPTKFRVDLGQSFTMYEITDADRQWALRLADKFKYTAKITYFTQTSLSLEVDGNPVSGAVYRQTDDPACFYVLPSDSMLKLGAKWASSQGVGGFSLHSPRSKRFLVALNSLCGGVPHLSSTPVQKGKVSWSGRAVQRL